MHFHHTPSLLVLLLTMNHFSICGQQDSVPVPCPPGQFTAKIFTNFHKGITRADRFSAFEVQRAYLGYQHYLNKNFSAEIKLNIGNPLGTPENTIINRYAYFKNAAFYYATERVYFKFGIIDIDLLDMQEDFWNHRYIAKSFMDEYRFGDKADLGAGFRYRIMNGVSADIAIMNGEGYKNIQNDNAFRTGIGITVSPIKDLTLRVYSDFIEKNEKQLTLVTFISYHIGPASAAFEYNHKMNRDFFLNHDQNGISAYVSWQLNDKFELFGRYDVLSSNIHVPVDRPWNYLNDGSAIISGVQYEITDGLKASVNYQDWNPYEATLDRRSYLYLNFEIIL